MGSDLVDPYISPGLASILDRDKRFAMRTTTMYIRSSNKKFAIVTPSQGELFYAPAAIRSPGLLLW